MRSFPSRRDGLAVAIKCRDSARIVLLDRSDSFVQVEKTDRTRFLRWSVMEYLRSKPSFSLSLSSGTLLAELIRYYFPDLVEMHNYVATSSVNQKKVNWQLLNKKVFNRLGLDLPESMMVDLSREKIGRIEIVLFNIKLKIDEEIELREKVHTQAVSSSVESSRPSVISSKLFKISKQNSSRSMCNITQRWVPRLDYEELKQQSFQQQEDIEILQAKIRRLEHILQLKDQRINELFTILNEQKRLSKPNYLSQNTKTKKV